MNTHVNCVHHWRIEEPNGATVKGKCKKCKATRTWKSYEERVPSDFNIQQANNWLGTYRLDRWDRE